MGQLGRNNSIPSSKIRAAFDLFLDRLSQKKIANNLNVSSMTIYRWSKKYNWKDKREDYMKDWMKETIKNKIETGRRFFI